jgi:hypothetical protein
VGTISDGARVWVATGRSRRFGVIKSERITRISRDFGHHCFGHGYGRTRYDHRDTWELIPAAVDLVRM